MLIIEMKFLTANVFIKAGFRSWINRDSLILQCMSDRPVAKISKLIHNVMYYAIIVSNVSIVDKLC